MTTATTTPAPRGSMTAALSADPHLGKRMALSTAGGLAFLLVKVPGPAGQWHPVVRFLVGTMVGGVAGALVWPRP